MTIKQIVQKLSAYRPTTYTALRRLFDLEYLGSGLYRSVYRIKGSNVVVKLITPSKEVSRHDQLEHVAAEVNWLHKLRREEWSLFHRHLPRLYYADLDNGVVAMKYYEVLADSDQLIDKKRDDQVARDCRWLNQLFKHLCDVNGEPENEDRTMDLGIGNLAVKENGDYVFIDLGYLS